jgi:cyclophilin family peptidyl-prolyl cis-trans isomerase
MNKAFSRNNYKQPANHEELYRTTGGIPHLDMRYTVYGEVISGMDVVDKICATATNRKDRPLKNMRIKTIIIQKQ